MPSILPQQERMTCLSGSADGVAMLLDLDNFPLHSRRSGLLTAIRLKVPPLRLEESDLSSRTRIQEHMLAHGKDSVSIKQ